MNTLLYATSIISIGFIIYILAMIFTVHKMQFFMYLLSFLVTCSGIGLCYLNQYYIISMILLCSVIFIIILHIGFQESKSKPKGCGSPLDSLLNQEAYTTQELTPRGFIIIPHGFMVSESEKIPARSTGVYIPQNTKVRIIKVTNKVAVVEEVSNE
jgi:membrane-bound ClpP family serine protease